MKEKIENENVEMNEEKAFDTEHVDETICFDPADVEFKDFVKAKWKKNKKKIIKGGAFALGAAAGLFILKTLMTEDEECEPILIDGNDFDYKLKGPNGEETYVSGDTTFEEAALKMNSTYELYNNEKEELTE